MSIPFWRGFSLLTGLVGAALFGLALLTVTLFPERLHDAVQGFAISKVEGHVRAALPAADTPAARGVEAARALAGRLAEQHDRLSAANAAGVPALVAAALAERCALDCRSRAGLTALITAAVEQRLAQITVGQQTLIEFVNDRYDRTVAALLRDIAIFSLTNALAFAGLALVAVFRGGFARRLAPFAVILLLALGLAINWYVFGQNWLAAILFNDYVGYGYLGFMAFIYLVLADIAFLHGAVTSHVLSSLASIFTPAC